MRQNLLALALLLALAPAFAADRSLPGASGAIPSVSLAGAASVPQLNSWLVGLNAHLNLPAQDLAAVSLHAAQAAAAAQAPVVAHYDAAAQRIVLAQPGAAAASAVINLSELPALRESLVGAGPSAQAWIDSLSKAKNPAQIERVLNGYFDGSVAAAAATVLDPQKHTVEVLAASLPENVRPASDPGARARQKKALSDWYASPRKTYIMVNSYSFKDDGTPGLNYYDMRPLAQILWAADPGVEIIFVTAMPLDEAMVQHVLRGHPHAAEIRKRLHFVSLNDAGTDFLSQKLLDPKHAGKLAEIRRTMQDIGSPAVLYPYMGGPYEWQIAAELGIPDSVYASHPTMFYWGSKSGGRKVFKEALKKYKGTKTVRIKLADGGEDLYNVDAAALALEALQQRLPGQKKVAVKLNLGSSGEGNLFPTVEGWEKMSHDERRAALLAKLEAAKVGLPDETGKIESFADILAREGAAVEQFIPGIERATFPSVQSEILPDGSVRIVSSHEQILVDRNNYVGATLSANKAYRKAVERAALEAAKELAKRGIVGRFGTDFAAVPQSDGTWDVYYIENNIRLTGTTHPMLAASGLTGGVYQHGKLRRPDEKGAIRYKAMDHDVRPNLVGLSVDGFLAHFDKPENRGLLFDPERRAGVLFHLLPAVKEGGNVGYTIIASSVKAVEAIQQMLTLALNRLELDHLTDGRLGDKKVVSVHHDAREQVEQAIGHNPQVKAFRAFLAANPEGLLARGGETGIVFHPHGYTVVAAGKTEQKRLQERAEALLAKFAAENGGAPAAK